MLALAVMLSVVALLSSALIVVAGLAAVRYLRQPEPPTLLSWPRVSILKPVKGLDAAAREGFVSFIEQDYPDFEVIFAVEDEEDPVLALIRELQAAYPTREIRLVNSSPRSVEMGKTNNVLAAQRAATGQVYVSADSDVIAGQGDLRRLVQRLYTPLDGKIVAVAGALPVYRRMGDFGAHLMGSYYSPFLLLYYSVKHGVRIFDVFPGTYYAIRPEALERVGGFARVGDNIADDSTLGQHLFEAGYACALSRVMGSVPEPNKSLANFWAHQYRWNLTYRMTIPFWQYLMLPMAHPFALVALSPPVFASAGIGAGWGWMAVAVYVVVRWLCVGSINLFVLREPAYWRSMVILPLTEVLLLGAWFRALVQTTTSWRGRVYRVRRGGSLVRLNRERSDAVRFDPNLERP